MKGYSMAMGLRKEIGKNHKKVNGATE